MAHDKAYRAAEKKIAEAKRTGVTELDLSEMELTELPESLFELTQLQSLDMSSNQITIIPDAIGKLANLQSLVMGNNKIAIIPDAIGKFSNLQLLDMGNNQIAIIPNAIGKLANLQSLYMSSNQIAIIPDAIGKLASLQSLDMGNNKIAIIPDAIGKLSNLQSLDMWRNQIAIIPDAIGKLVNLQLLDMGTNQISIIPEAIFKLANLQSLHMSSNQIVIIPDAIGKLVNLQSLVIWGNQIAIIPDAIFKFANLQSLNMGHNQIAIIPDAIGKLVNLQSLDMGNNQIAIIPEAIFKLVNLQSLHMSSNQIAIIPDAIGKLANLQSLDMSSNQIAIIPDAIGKFSNLQSLDMSSNQLTNLPKELRRLDKLEKLFLHDNPKLNLPPEVLGPTSSEVTRKENTKPHPPQSILDYYFRPMQPLNEAKLVLVGFGKVGKTSLVEKLIHGTFNPDQKKTEGIAITQWSLTVSTQDDIRMHVWDFGGQEIMHSTHQFFLSRRSLYLLVLNGRQGHEDSDAEYWMNLIRSFGGDSPVIVVLNKQQEHPFDLNRKNLESKFPGMIKGFIKTECDNQDGTGELKAKILMETDRLEGLRDGFPAEWIAIKDKLASMTDNYLTFEEYRRICQDLGEKAQMDQDRLAGYLHQLGVALNYKDDPRLRDMHVLNPRWVTEGIYTLLNAKKLEENKGELHLKDLEQILDLLAYPSARHPFLLNLMRKFYLCFEFPDQRDHYLIPDLLDKNQPPEADEFDPKECLNFQYKYTSLHEGVIPSFITRTYIIIDDKLRWRTGVILAFEGCRALVKGDLTEKMVTISIQGEGEARTRLLAVIRSNFEDIHRNFQFQPKELVPVPQHPEVIIKYDDLMTLEKNSIPEKQEVADGEILNVPVLDLLNDVDLKGSRQSIEKHGEEKQQGVKIFCSYSHADEALKKRLETHLTILKRQRLIDFWHDRCIIAGEEWGAEIDRNLEEANIILLLISADFIASDYCHDIEMKRAMERHTANKARVIPIILSEANWQNTEFADLQALPTGARPVTTYGRREKAWTEISKALEDITRATRTKERKSEV